MTGGKVIALSWLTFATLIVVWGGLWLHILIPVLALFAWTTGTFFILRRKTP